MNNEQEEELLMHVAAGTDLPTALAAMQRDEQPRTRGWVLVLATMFIVWWLLR